MYTIGIDLGGTVMKTGLVRDGRIVDCRTAAADSQAGFDAVLDGMAGAVDLLLGANGVEKEELDGVAVAFAGQVDVRRRRVCGTNGKYDGVDNVDLEEWARDRWACDFFIDNDARMAIVGEWKYGAGQDVDDLVAMTIGTGIGTSVITGGRLLRGPHSQFGCLGGHLTVNFGGRECTCGNRGCVEAEAGSWALPAIAAEHPGFAGSALAEFETIDYATLFSLAARGDRVACEVRDRCMDVWGAAIVTYIHAYDPQVVVIGGGVMRSADVILPHVQAYTDSYAWTPGHRVEVRCAQLGDTSAILGAAYCFNDKNLQE